MHFLLLLSDLAGALKDTFEKINQELVLQDRTNSLTCTHYIGHLLRSPAASPVWSISIEETIKSITTKVHDNFFFWLRCCIVPWPVQNYINKRAIKLPLLRYCIIKQVSCVEAYKIRSEITFLSYKVDPISHSLINPIRSTFQIGIFWQNDMSYKSCIFSLFYFILSPLGSWYLLPLSCGCIVIYSDFHIPLKGKETCHIHH